MKTLILLRHAQAAAGDRDYERPLTRQGHQDAARAGRALAAASLHPEYVLVSGARRTRETYEELAGVLGGSPRVTLAPTLYEGSWGVILGLVQAVPDEVACLLVVGHNPGLGEATRQLVNEGAEPAFANLRRRFPTAGSAVIEVPVPHWSGIAAGGTLKHLLWVGENE